MFVHQKWARQRKYRYSLIRNTKAKGFFKKINHSYHCPYCCQFSLSKINQSCNLLSHTHIHTHNQTYILLQVCRSYTNKLCKRQVRSGLSIIVCKLVEINYMGAAYSAPANRYNRSAAISRCINK